MKKTILLSSDTSRNRDLQKQTILYMSTRIIRNMQLGFHRKINNNLNAKLIEKTK